MTDVLLEGRSLGASRGGRTLFSKLDLHLSAGQRLFVQGPSGSGKTTLLRMIALLEPLDQGELALKGEPMADWSPPQWRRQVLYVPQRAPNLDGNPADALASVRHFAANRHQEAAPDPIALAERWRLDPGKWQESWERLSGGERQRVLLAMALAQQPALLLLDEPTSALDHEARTLVWESLKEVTALWVTHDPSERDAVGGDVLSLA
jgi:putative ABC transport system ATP-binding protein